MNHKTSISKRIRLGASRQPGCLYILMCDDNLPCENTECASLLPFSGDCNFLLIGGHIEEGESVSVFSLLPNVRFNFRTLLLRFA